MSGAKAIAVRRETYRVFEIIAWPTFAWCAVETALRVVAMEADGVAAPGLMALCAAGMIAAARRRRA